MDYDKSLFGTDKAPLLFDMSMDAANVDYKSSMPEKARARIFKLHLVARERAFGNLSTPRGKVTSLVICSF